MRSTPACSNASIARRAKLAGVRLAAGVHRERAAAPLRRRRDDLAALGRQHADGRVVDVREGEPLHATGQEADPHAALADGGRHFGRRRASAIDGDFGGASFASARSRSGSRFSSPLRSSSGSDPLVNEQRRQREPQPPRIRNHREQRRAEQPVAERPRRSGARSARAWPRSSGAYSHARGARGDARHAAETGVEVADEGIGHPHAPLEAGLHQIDPPARRIHLLAPQRVGRTGRQTEAAVHALVDQRASGGW